MPFQENCKSLFVYVMFCHQCPGSDKYAMEISLLLILELIDVLEYSSILQIGVGFGFSHNFQQFSNCLLIHIKWSGFH